MRRPTSPHDHAAGRSDNAARRARLEVLSRCRVFGRSNNNGNANGGLVYSNTNNGASNSNSNNGARLANITNRLS